ncbi:hypothetical protein D3C87_1691670 [compost metagenome]
MRDGHRLLAGSDEAVAIGIEIDRAEVEEVAAPRDGERRREAVMQDELLAPNARPELRNLARDASHGVDQRGIDGQPSGL